MELMVALAGNPNSGKSTLFNELTGARQHVGNYPGVTVEKKEGLCLNNGERMRVVDLPGIYSLTAYSPEEVVARNFLVKDKPAVVIDVVDASNLERNLYLTVQFMELGVPLCLALNMMDVARNRGIEIDVEKLSRLLGMPVIPVVARSGRGKKELLAAACEVSRIPEQVGPLNISYGEDVDLVLRELEGKVAAAGFLTETFPARWVALKYLENDDRIRTLGKGADPELSLELERMVAKLAKHLEMTLNVNPEAMIVDHRYGFIRSLMKQGVMKERGDRNRLYVSDRIDRVLTNRFAGPPIMVAVIFGLYHFIFTYSEAPVGWVEGLFGWLGGIAEARLADGLLKSLVISGIIDGVGGVLGFVPLIMFMFFGISLLEDSGYLARIAYMLDRIFRVFGLHGSSVMPFIVSGGIAGGCAVPGVMASRTLKSPKERLATLLTVPFMNCGAKLPVFALLVGAFFAEHGATVMFLITLISWTGALLAAKVLRLTVIRGESTPFVMELPPYRLPTFQGLLIHTWERTWQYIKKAGTVILGISILLWATMTFPGLPENRMNEFDRRRLEIAATAPATVNAELESGAGVADLTATAKALRSQLLMVDAEQAEATLKNSLAGRLGAALEGVSLLAGFDWRTNIALVGGFAAKEVVVSTLGTAYSLGEVDPEGSGALSERLASSPGWSPLPAWSLIVFTIFYAPCVVTVVCIAKEAGSWKWGAFSMVFNTTLAFGLSVAVYQLGSFFRIV